MPQDLLIKQDVDKGCFDLVIGEQDFKTVDGLETAVGVLLFTDARAAPEEVNDVSRRRGWIGNILREIELGGMLWLAAQVRNTQSIRNKIVGWAEDSLQILIDDGLASEIIVSVEQRGNRSAVLNITINVKEGETSKFEYWLNTDLRNLINGN